MCVCAEELEELRKKEKEAGYTPDWELDAFMKAEIRKGKRESIVTDLVIKLLGLDVSILILPDICFQGCNQRLWFLAFAHILIGND